MDKGLLNLIILILVIGGAILKPWIERRKKRLEEERTGRPAPAQAPTGDEPDDGPKLPYEDLVDEVFGPYMERRREKARPPAPPPEPVAAAVEPPKEPAAPQHSFERQTEATRARFAPSSVETAAVDRPVEERIFGNLRLSPTAKLILAADILQPRRPGGRGGAFRR